MTEENGDWGRRSGADRKEIRYMYIQGPPIVRQSPLLPLISIFFKKVFNETYNRSRRAFSKISFNYTGCFAEGGRHQSNFF